MSGLPDIALAVAVVLGGAVTLLLLYVGVRRLLVAWLLGRMDRRVRRARDVLVKHQREQFASVDRLLFQLGELHDLSAVETALGQILKSADGSVTPRLQKIYASLGLVEVYIRRLKDAPAWSDRAEAATALGQLGVARAIPNLVAVMRDPHEDTRTVRLAAAQALAQMEAAEAVPLLVAELATPDEWASPRIAEILVGFGSGVVPVLIETLATESTNARVWAAQIIGRIGSAIAEPQLVALLRDRHEQVRISAAEALGHIRSRQAVNELTRVALKDPVAPVRAEAARALGAIGDETALQALVMLLSDPDYWSRLRAIEAIELIGPSDPSCLEAALRDPSADIRRRAAVALERVGVLSRMVEELASPDSATMDRAHRALAEMGRAGLLESILALVEHPDFHVRFRMASVLGEIGDPSSVAALGSLTLDPVWPVRAAAVEALARLGSSEAVKLIIPALSDDEETVRAAAATSMQTVAITEHDGALATLLGLFDTSNSEIRASVVQAVGHLDHEAVNDMLRRALDDPTPDVRLRGVRAVAARVEPRWLEALVGGLADPQMAVRIEAAQGLGRLGTAPALSAIVDSLTTPHRELREALTTLLASQGFQALQDLTALPQTRETTLALVWTLGKTRDPRAIDNLQRFYDGGDADLRAAVAGALAKIEHPDTEPILCDMLDDRGERVRAAAVNALGSLGSKQAVPRLRLMLQDPDPFVRQRAVLSLGRIAGAEGLAGLEEAQARFQDPEFQGYVVLGYGVCGGQDAFGKAVRALAEPAMQERVQRLLQHQPAEVRDLFLHNLHLDRENEEPSLVTAALVEKYTTTLRTHQDPGARAAAIEALRSLQADSCRDVLMDAVSTDPSPQVRRLAVLALGNEAATVADVMKNALRDPALEVQIEAATCLGTTRDPTHNHTLLNCFTAGEPALDRAVITTLASNNRDDVPSFIDELMGESEFRVLRGGAAVLGALGHPCAVSLLRSWLGSRDVGLRAACARSLGTIGAIEARDALIPTLTDVAEEVRLAGAEALGQLPGTDALRALQLLTRDPSPRVRLYLARLIGSLRQVGALELAEAMGQDPNEEIRLNALLSLLLLRDVGAMERFIDLAANQPHAVQNQLRQTSTTHPAMEVLHETVRSNASAAARVAALRSIVWLGRPALDVLLKALADPSVEVRVAAVEATNVMRSEPAVQEVLDRLLRDPEKRVQDAVRKLRVSVFSG